MNTRTGALESDFQAATTSATQAKPQSHSKWSRRKFISTTLIVSASLWATIIAITVTW